ncbi:hypothetical protein E4U28_006185 [Claviceps purpurea]|nr:hypothetical protein E4U28_006185 [Claviceps purpurea]
MSDDGSRQRAGGETGPGGPFSTCLDSRYRNDPAKGTLDPTSRQAEMAASQIHPISLDSVYHHFDPSAVGTQGVKDMRYRDQSPVTRHDEFVVSKFRPRRLWPHVDWPRAACAESSVLRIIPIYIIRSRNKPLQTIIQGLDLGYKGHLEFLVRTNQTPSSKYPESATHGQPMGRFWVFDFLVCSHSSPPVGGHGPTDTQGLKKSTGYFC